MNRYKLTAVTLAVLAAVTISDLTFAGEPAWGHNSGSSGIAIAGSAEATNYETIAIGVRAKAVGNRAQAFGTDANAVSINSMSFGNWTRSQGSGASAFGTNSKAIGNNSVALGSGASVGSYTAATGTEGEEGYVPEKVEAYSGGVAVGGGAAVRAANGMALGASSSVSAASAVAIGSSSVADRAANTTGFSFNGEANTDKKWQSKLGAVAVGSSTQTRQITGVAAGSEETDAVNLAQLKSLQAYTDGKFIDTGNQLTNIETQLSTIETASKENTIFGSGASNLISAAVEAVPADPDNGVEEQPAKDAVYAQNAVALGNNAKVQADGAVAIGVNSIAQSRFVETTDETTGITTRTAPTGYLMPKTGDVNTAVWQGDVSQGVVSFGGSYQKEVKDSEGRLPGEEGYVSTTETVNFNRQLTGVAAGSEDNDAVNVAQLKQLESNTKTELNSLMTGDTQVSKIQLTSDPTDETAPTIGLRYEMAKAEPVALADGDPVTPTTSQGRLVYDSLDTNGNVIGTEKIATLNDGFFVKGGNTGADDTGVKVDLNQGISFLGDEYLQTTVTAGENGGAVVTVGASQALKDFLTNSGVQPSDPSTPSEGGSTGGTWTPNAAQQAALNGNFSNGITVAAGEGNEAIQIKQGNVDMGGNRIQNVGNPIAAGDAANKQYVDSTARSLRNKINDVDKDLRAGVAMAMAVAGLPQAYMPGKSIVGVSAGTYHGQGGFALGLSHATDNRQWVFKGAASVDTRGNVGGTLSAGYQF